jgi:hypothetical protein
MDLPWHLKTLACSVVHPKLDENEQPPLVNDYVDLPVANILHPSGHVVPTPLLTIMEDQSIVETVKSEILIIARTPQLTPWLEHGG